MYFTSMLHLKLVSAGTTRLDRLIYKGFPDPWINMLNERIKPSELSGGPSLAYSPTELRERVIAAANAVDIRKQRVNTTGGAFGVTPWAR